MNTFKLAFITEVPFGNRGRFKAAATRLQRAGIRLPFSIVHHFVLFPRSALWNVGPCLPDYD